MRSWVKALFFVQVIEHLQTQEGKQYLRPVSIQLLHNILVAECSNFSQDTPRI